jgi:hypothetical protein
MNPSPASQDGLFYFSASLSLWLGCCEIKNPDPPVADGILFIEVPSRLAPPICVEWPKVKMNSSPAAQDGLFYFSASSSYRFGRSEIYRLAPPICGEWPKVKMNPSPAAQDGFFYFSAALSKLSGCEIKQVGFADLRCHSKSQ